MPTVRFDEIEAGVTYTAHRDLADGRSMDRVSTWMVIRSQSFAHHTAAM